MGVDRSDYLVYGWKFPYDRDVIDVYYDEDLCEKLESQNEYVFVTDGMMGEYMVFGKLLSYSGDYEGWEFTDIDETLKEVPNKLSLYSAFDQYTGSKINEVLLKHNMSSEPSTFLFSHFS